MHYPKNWARRMADPATRACYAQRLAHLRRSDPEGDHTHFLAEAVRIRDLLDQGVKVPARRWLGKEREAAR